MMPDPKILDYQSLKEIETLCQKDLEKLLSQIFEPLEKKPYQNAQDKKVIELIGNVLTYIEAVKYTNDKLTEDWRYAWESYWLKDEQEKTQYNSFAAWFKKNKHKLD